MNNGYKDLIVWQKSMDFAVAIYKIIEKLPRFEQFGLVSQITRAVTSVPANIAEGCTRKSYKEKVQFLYISYGSLSETETYIELMKRLGYLAEKEGQDLENQKEEIRKMLHALIAKFKNN